MQFFTPNHVKLLTSCYPPASALLTAGPDYAPNSHELSRLTYYASNNPGKLTKIGSELDKRLKAECRKAKSGNIRSRVALLISLSIFRSLAMECRRDIALLSPSLISSVESVLGYLPEDLEVVARVASVFTTWTTYTNGHLIGADSTVTNEYFSILKQFSSLSAYNSSDKETQNRTRLIGLAALTAALNSDALYNDIRHFGVQVSTIILPVLVILFETSMSTLDDQASIVKDSTFSPYLAEFRTRPTLERRAVSIHAHVDGDQGPSMGDVSDAALHALFSLVSHTNSAQLGLVMQSTFDCLDEVQGWKKLDHCCWYAQKIAEWAQYQYRHAVPTWLVERLLSHQDTSSSTPVQRALTAMITSVFSSSTPFINLSSSDIMSNLLTLLLRCISVNAEDPTLPSLVECISSLGCHVYYSDQIQDLANELINRLVLIEVQGVLVADKSSFLTTRSAGIHYLLESLVGLVRAANTNLSSDADGEAQRTSSVGLSTLETRTSIDRHSRRTRVPPDIWQDTLSLLCDADMVVRRECAMALIYYLAHEMPRHHELCDTDGLNYSRKAVETSFRQLQNTFPNAGDAASKFLNAVHAYIYILAISPTLHNTMSVSEAPDKQSLSNVNAGAGAAGSDEQHERTESTGHLTPPQNGNSRRSYISQNGSRARKESLVLKLLEKAPTRYNTPAQASEEDYANVLKIFTAIHVHLPMHGLLTGVPMLLALNTASETNRTEGELLQRIVTIKTVIAHVWLILAQLWKIQELVIIAERAISKLTSLSKEEINSSLDSLNLGVDADTALTLMVSSKSVQDAFKLDRDNLLRQLSSKWTPELALKDFEKSSGFEKSFRGDGVSPLLKISPALMHIENISLQSLARSTRGLGVTDLREALEGRSGMSNPTLTRPPSVSTLDHASSFASGDVHNLRLTQTRSRSRAKKHPHPNGANEVRDVLSRLGISKQSSSLLKATFPVKQKS